MGQENMTPQDYAIPRIAILQDLSPQVLKRDERYIEGAEVGDICDVVSNVLYSGEEGILVIPVSYRRAYTEWVPRSKGGGFVADRTPVGDAGEREWQKFRASCEQGEKGLLITPAGNELRQSAEYFVFLIDGKTGEYQPFVLNMGGTQLKKSRRWNTMMNQLKIEYNGQRINPAMFYRSYRLTTVPERNDQGTWMGWQITPADDVVSLPNGEQTYLDAKEFRKSVQSGKVSAAAPVSPEDSGPAGVAGDDEPM